MTTVEMGGATPYEVFDATYNPDEILGLPALNSELQDTTLRPYDDDEFFNNRLLSKNRVLRRNPDAARFIGEVLERDDDESLYAMAEMLDDAWATSTSGKEPAVATILSFITLIQGIEDTHDATLGETGPHARANALAHLLARNLSLRIPDSRVSEFMLSNQYVMQRMQEAQLDRTIGRKFINVKLRMFNDLLTSRALGIAYANAIQTQDVEPVDEAEIASDTEEFASHFGQIRAAQQYGMKLAYKRHYLGGSMIFNEPATLEEVTVTKPENVHPLTFETAAVAELTHSRQTSFQKLKRQETRLQEGDAIGMTYGQIGTISLFYLDAQGELFVDRFLNHSVRDIFVSQQKYGAYRALQADVLASYFDLTQATIVVNRIKRELPATAATPSPHETPDEIIRRLVVPRLHALREPETEAQQTETDTSARTLRYHGVTWHRRTLPDGWSPSPQALELAEKAGVDLKPGETFVKAHHRGSKEIGEVVAHQVVEES